MSLVRIIATVLILVMTSTPALASVCAISCATGEVMANSSVSVAKNDSAMTSDHCHQLSDEANKGKSPDNHHPEPAHKSCAMIGCNFSQATPLVTLVQVPTLDFVDTPLSYFNPSAFSADLPPPIKPPA